MESSNFRILTLLTGKFIGEDEFGNKYYQNKNKKDGLYTKTRLHLNSEWYSWIHNTKNKIENNHKFTKYHTTPPVNKTGTKIDIIQKIIKMLSKKNIQLGKINFFLIISFFLLIKTNIKANENDNLIGDFIDLKILDKVSSKDQILKIKIGEIVIHKNLSIKATKCKNSEFDDDPEIITYIQVKDINEKSKDKVFIFNGWMFSSSPSLNPFDHPVYDLWVIKCYN